MCARFSRFYGSTGSFHPLSYKFETYDKVVDESIIEKVYFFFLIRETHLYGGAPIYGGRSTCREIDHGGLTSYCLGGILFY